MFSSELATLRRLGVRHVSRPLGLPPSHSLKFASSAGPLASSQFRNGPLDGLDDVERVERRV